MALTLYYHPFSSYSWKALIAFHETGAPFTPRRIDDPQAAAEWLERWPVARFPVLVDDASNLTLPEASIIIEYLDGRHPGPQQSLLPADPDQRLQVRLLDRVFDNYVHASLQKIVGDRLRDAANRDTQGVDEARSKLSVTYAWLDARVGNAWAAGDAFTLADCAAAPALFYADWVHPIGGGFPALSAYRARLLARPSVKRVVDDARPMRHLFPGGAPDRD